MDLFRGFTLPKIKTLFIFLSFVIFLAPFSSCLTTKPNTYFQTIPKDTVLKAFVNEKFDSKIQKNDILKIVVSSLSHDLDQQFNASVNAVSDGTGAKEQSFGYLVNKQGFIVLHYLGTIKAEGLTRVELQQKLQIALLPFMKDPIISVEYVNHKITVLGQVARPQVINMPEEQMTLIDALAYSGDLSDNGNRRNIMIIREEANGKEIKHINLEDHSIFSSEWYNLKPNDVVYVMADNETKSKEEKRRNLQTVLSLGISIVSLIVILLNSLLK